MHKYIIQSLTGANTTQLIICEGESMPDAIKKRFSFEVIQCKKHESGDADFIIKSTSSLYPRYYKIYREKATL